MSRNRGATEPRKKKHVSRKLDFSAAHHTNPITHEHDQLADMAGTTPTTTPTTRRTKSRRARTDPRGKGRRRMSVTLESPTISRSGAGFSAEVAEKRRRAQAIAAKLAGHAQVRRPPRTTGSVYPTIEEKSEFEDKIDARQGEMGEHLQAQYEDDVSELHGRLADASTEDAMRMEQHEKERADTAEARSRLPGGMDSMPGTPEPEPQRVTGYDESMAEEAELHLQQENPVQLIRQETDEKAETPPTPRATKQPTPATTPDYMHDFNLTRAPILKVADAVRDAAGMLSSALVPKVKEGELENQLQKVRAGFKSLRNKIPPVEFDRLQTKMNDDLSVLKALFDRSSKAQRREAHINEGDVIEFQSRLKAFANQKGVIFKEEEFDKLLDEIHANSEFLKDGLTEALDEYGVKRMGELKRKLRKSKKRARDFIDLHVQNDYEKKPLKNRILEASREAYLISPQKASPE